jgi:hypothetical protein
MRPPLAFLLRQLSVLATAALAAAAAEPAPLPGEEIAAMSFLTTGETRFEDSRDPALVGRVRLQEAALLAPFAAVPVGPVTLAAAGWAGQTRLDFEDYPGLGTEDLRGAAFVLAADRPATNRWGWSAVAMPGYYGEARFMAQALARCRLSAAWRVELGAAWDDAFGDPQLFPVGGAVWRPADEFAVQLRFPAPALNWAPTENLGLAAFLRPAGDRWVDHDDGDEWVFVLEGWRAGLGLEHRVWKRLRLRLAGGAEFERRYEAERAGRTELDGDAEDTWFAEATLAVY